MNATGINPSLRTHIFVTRKLEGINHIKQSLNLGTCTTTANAWPTTITSIHHKSR